MGWTSRCQANSSLAFEEPDDVEAANQLELSIISAQDVKKEKFVGQMQAYAIAWIKQDCKMKTHMVSADDLHPTWNARLNFQVQDDLLKKETNSAITIEIFCQGRLRDTLLGTVRVLLSNLTKKGKGYQGAQSLALQIRRPSGRPQGILNVGSMLLDYDANLMRLPPMREFNLLDDHHRLPPLKFSPLKEFQEICRRSFSVSRDDLSREKPSKRFALDDNSLDKLYDMRNDLKPPSLAVMEVNYDDKGEEEAVEAIYRKLKSFTRGGKFDAEEEKSSEPTINKQVDCSNGDLEAALSKGYNESKKELDDDQCTPEFYEYKAMDNLSKIQDKGFDQRLTKLNQQKLEPGDFTRLHQQKEFDSCAVKQLLLQQKGLVGDNGAIKVNDDPVRDVVFVWNDLTLQKKKELLSDDLISRADACYKPRNRAVWAKRASWALRKGAAKIHLSPSDK